MLAMILFILLPFAGFSLGIQYEKALLTYPPATQIVRSSSPPANIITANWKTYNNPEGWRVQYPEDMHIENRTDVWMGAQNTPNTTAYIFIIGENTNITITSALNPDQLTTDAWLDKKEQQFKTHCAFGCIPPGPREHLNNPADTILVYSRRADALEGIIGYVPYMKEMITFTASSTNANGRVTPQTKQLLLRILSTFAPAQ